MNIPMVSPDGHEYYVACVKREGDKYVALGKCVLENGALRVFGGCFEFQTQRDAERKCRELARTKAKRRRFHEIDLESVPKVVQEYLEVPVDMQLSPQEMVRLVTRSKVERYVVFQDVEGIEAYYDAGVEYIGYEVQDEPDYLEVHDRFGELRHCFASRMSSVVPTERCEEIGGLDGR